MFGRSRWPNTFEQPRTCSPMFACSSIRACTHKSRLVAAIGQRPFCPPEADIRRRIEHVCLVNNRHSAACMIESTGSWEHGQSPPLWHSSPGGRAEGPDQPPIVTLLLQSGGVRPAASSERTRSCSSLSNSSCRIAFASCSSDPRRSAIGFDCSSRINS